MQFSQKYLWESRRKKSIPLALFLHCYRLTSIMLIGVLSTALLLLSDIWTLAPLFLSFPFALLASRTIKQFTIAYYHWFQQEFRWFSILHYIRRWDPFPFWVGIVAPFGVAGFCWFVFHWIRFHYWIPTTFPTFLFQTWLFFGSFTVWVLAPVSLILYRRIRLSLFPPPPHIELITRFYRELPYRMN